MERGTPGYELVDKTEDLIKSIGRKFGIQNPFAAQQAVIEDLKSRVEILEGA